MNEHEEKTVASFLLKEKRSRFRHLLSSPRKRRAGLDRLNHCSDLDPKFVEWLLSNADVIGILKQAGSPSQVYLISADSSLDASTLPLAEAVEAAARCGWGTIISCIPGKLAYYYDECGERRAILRNDT